MEGLGWWIYLCSISGGLLAVALIFLIISVVAFVITSLVYLEGDCKLGTAKQWWKYSSIIAVISTIFVIFVPSKTTCYKIFGVTVATEVIKNSEALQELPEKSFEALNRLLDSIAVEDDKDKSKE